jgi:hypothetical protein
LTIGDIRLRQFPFYVFPFDNAAAAHYCAVK